MERPQRKLTASTFGKTHCYQLPGFAYRLQNILSCGGAKLFEVDPTDKWEFVSAVLQAAGTFVSFLAALAAWFAAVASKRAVNEMAAARHQYVKPVLVFSEPSNIEINLGVWRDDGGAGHPTYDAKIAVTNVGKGPAYGVELVWNVNGMQRVGKVPIDVSAINEVLAESHIELVEDDKKWTIRVKGNEGYFWSAAKFNYISKSDFAKIGEDETVYIRIPSDILALQVIHSLNQMAIDFKEKGIIPGYACPESWKMEEADELSVNFRSITDDLYGLKFDAVPRLGILGYHERVPFLASMKVSLHVKEG